jgi:hypothetical protein
MTDLGVEKASPVRAIRMRGVISAPVAMTLAALTLGASLQINYGQYHPIAIQLLTVSLAAASLAVFKMQDRSLAQLRIKNDSMLPAVLAGALLIQFAILLACNPTAQPMAPRDLMIFRIGIIVAAGLSPLLFGGARTMRAATILLPAIYFLVGLWVLRCVPPPPVDICMFQNDACRAMLHGINPYSIDFPNLYANPSKMYDASVVVNGRLLFGFPYPPLSLLATIPGYIAGDFRLAHLAAMTIAGAMIMRMSSGRVAGLAGMLFLFTPRSFFIIEAGFTEPIVAMLFVAVVLAADHQWRSLPILFGLLLVSKQYLILAAPLGLLIFPREGDELDHRGIFGGDQETAVSKLTGYTKNDGVQGKRGVNPWLIAIAIALVVTLPLALWNLPAFMRSVAFLQFHQPMRADSLSYLPTLIGYTGWRPLLAIPFVLAIALIAIFLRRLPRTPSAFAAGVALLFFIFFATNKQAFCGYYLVVLAGLCTHVAVASSPDDTGRKTMQNAK